VRAKAGARGQGIYGVEGTHHMSERLWGSRGADIGHGGAAAPSATAPRWLRPCEDITAER